MRESNVCKKGGGGGCLFEIEKLVCEVMKMIKP